MKYESKQLQQMLAAEYVLGTLQGRARARFERLLRGNPALVAEVRYWEQRLAGLALRLPPQAPPPMVWTRIDHRINASRPGAFYRAARQVNFWRAWAVAASIVSVGFGFKLWQLLLSGPQFIEVPTIVAVQSPPKIVEVIREVPQPMPYVAVLSPGGDLQYVLALSPGKHLIKVRASGSKMPVDISKRSLQLWLLDEAGKPHSLGVMPNSGEAEMPMPENAPMPKKLTLAISEEPMGGSPTGQPTGKVLTAAPALQAL